MTGADRRARDGSPRLDLAPLIGHRGAAADAPENTLAGLRAAKRLGASWVEFDVQLSRDGVPILLHDETLDRTSNGHGPALALSLDELRQLDCGSWFGRAFAGERIPTLGEAIEVLEACGLGANIELKPAAGTESDTAHAVARTLRRSWPQSLPTPLISSFSRGALETFRAQAPEFPRGLLFGELPPDWAAAAEALDCVSIHCDHRALDAARIRTVVERGYDLLAYTVNEPSRARDLWGWGVSAVFTDVLGKMVGIQDFHRRFPLSEIKERLT